MMHINSTDRITVCGLPGTGKTTFSKYLAELCGSNLLIYDPLDQYKEFPDECRYIPRSDSLEEFEEVCGRLCARSNVTFLIEEVERYLGQGKPLGPNAFDLVNRGRNWGVGIIAVTRRIQKLSKDYFDLCQTVIFFRCGLKSRKYIYDMLGKEESYFITRLPKYHFLHYSLEEENYGITTLVLGGGPKLVSDPELTSEMHQQTSETNPPNTA